MTVVNIVVKRGMRHGTFSIDNIEGDFPTQAIIEPTNINHMENFGNRNLDFGTRIVEIFYKNRIDILRNKKRRDIEIAKLKRKFNRCPSNMIHLLGITGIRSEGITKEDNKNLITVQDKVGFKYIKVFIGKTKNLSEDIRFYEKLIPEDKVILPVLDEAMKPKDFEGCYMHWLNKIPIMGFFGRNPLHSTPEGVFLTKNHNILLNSTFIQIRKGDKILRLVSGIEKTFRGVSKSGLYKILGYDVFSFRPSDSRTYHISKNNPLSAMVNFRYRAVQQGENINCDLREGVSFRLVLREMRAKKMETVPCSIATTKGLNDSFKRIHETEAEAEFNEIYEDIIKPIIKFQKQNQTQEHLI